MAQNGFLQAIESFGENFFPGIQRLWNKWTGKTLTPAENEANAFTASEAQKQRDWEQQMSNTSYQRSVKDMQAAGVNPAMAMSQGGASTPSGSSATSVSPSEGMLSMSDIMSLVLMPLQRRLLAAQAKQASDSGEAALMQGKAAMQNAATNEGTLGVRQGELQSLRERIGIERYDAETRRMQAEINKSLADAQIPTEQSKRDLMAQQMAEIRLSMEYLPKQIAIAKQNADASTRQAMASWENAMAAVQNAATNDRLADSQIALNAASEAFKWIETEEGKVVLRYLDDTQKQTLENLRKQGVHLDKQNKLVDKTGNLVDARTAATYVEMAATINDGVYKWVNPLAGMSAKPAKVSFGAAAGMP